HHVGSKAPVGQRQVERVLAGGSLEVDGGQVHRGEALGDGVGGGQLGDSLAVDALHVGVGSGHDDLVEVVGALGGLLDRSNDPAVVATGKGPVLGDVDELVLLAVAHDLLAVGGL